jgi:hypothetical protein
MVNDPFSGISEDVLRNPKMEFARWEIKRDEFLKIPNLCGGNPILPDEYDPITGRLIRYTGSRPITDLRTGIEQISEGKRESANIQQISEGKRESANIQQISEGKRESANIQQISEGKRESANIQQISEGKRESANIDQISMKVRKNEDIDQIFTERSVNDKTLLIHTIPTDEEFHASIANTPRLSDVTKYNYKRTYINIQRDIMPKYTLYRILLNPHIFAQNVTVYLKTHKNKKGEPLSLSFQNSMYAAMIALFIHNQHFANNNIELFEHWKNLLAIRRKPIEDMYDSNLPTDKQIKSYIPLTEIIKIRDSLPYGSIEKILVLMYTAIPPVRCDYHQLKIYTSLLAKRCDEYHGNYILSDDDITDVILQKYKTAKHHGTISIELPDEVWDEIEYNLELSPRSYLFVNKNGDMFSNKVSFRWWAKPILCRLFGENFTLHTFRHIYVTDKINYLTYDQKKKMAGDMCHSLHQQSRYAWDKTKLVNFC